MHIRLFLYRSWLLAVSKWQSLKIWLCCVCMYRISPNFQGTNFSRIGLLQFFGRNKFRRSKDFHYPCPVLLVTCTICVHSRNNAMLGCSLSNPSFIFQTKQHEPEGQMLFCLENVLPLVTCCHIHYHSFHSILCYSSSKIWFG